MKNAIAKDLEDLCLLPSLSGHEQLVSNYLKEQFELLDLQVTVDVLGNTYTCIKGKDHSKKVLVTGHMDSPGLMVKTITDEGFIRFERVGGIPEKTLPALRVAVQAKDRYVPGVIGVKSHHLTSAEEKYKVDKYQELYIDIGCYSRKEVLDLGIRIGNAITYYPTFVRLQNDIVSGTFFDNRIACTCLIELAKLFSKNAPDCDVYLAGTVQEEYTIRGAITAARAVQPDAIICLDAEVAADTPDLKGTGEVKLGEGPAMSLYNFHGRGTLNGTMPHPSLVRLYEESAEESGINLQRVAGIGGLTELAYMQLEGNGIAGIDIGAPFRYSHSCIETSDLNDIEQTIKLTEHVIRKIDKNCDLISR